MGDATAIELYAHDKWKEKPHDTGASRKTRGDWLSLGVTQVSTAQESASHRAVENVHRLYSYMKRHDVSFMRLIFGPRLVLFLADSV